MHGASGDISDSTQRSDSLHSPSTETVASLLSPGPQGAPDTPTVSVLHKYVSLRVFLTLLSIATAGLVLVYATFDEYRDSIVAYYLVHEIGKGLFITALISFGVNALIARQSGLLKAEEERLRSEESQARFGAIANALHGVEATLEQRTNILFKSVSSGLSHLEDGVKQQASELLGSVASLQALHDAGINRVYRDREAAAPDIKTAFRDSQLSNIKIIGISLNDFLRDDRPALRDVWRIVEERLRNSNDPVAPRLRIQLLLVDPSSRGAVLRADAEQEQDEDSTRLYEDVRVAMEILDNLQCKHSNGSAVTLEVRLYNAAPILYLVRTPSVSFLQQYYFRPTHRQTIPIPVFRASARDRADSGGSFSIHDELGFHFDWLWQHASIPAREYIDGSHRSVDQAAAASHIRGIYYDSGLSRQRILGLIRRETTRRIWIKGISLRSFLRDDSELYAALFEACKRADADVRLLLIDPECDQARLRSFREYRIRHPDATLDSFTDKDRQNQRLYRDTLESIDQVLALAHELSLQPVRGAFATRLFDSAPEAFLFLTEDTAIVEQYHYGKIEGKREAVQGVLGGEVPLFEYVNSAQGSLKDPYRMFQDHFTFVFEHCARALGAPS